MVIRGTRNQSPFAIKFTQLCQFRTLLEQSLITFISDLRQLACFLNNYDKLKKKRLNKYVHGIQSYLLVYNKLSSSNPIQVRIWPQVCHSFTLVKQNQFNYLVLFSYCWIQHALIGSSTSKLFFFANDFRDLPSRGLYYGGLLKETRCFVLSLSEKNN